MNDFVETANVKVISVNPSQKTVGALNSDLIATVARRCRPKEINIRSVRLKTLVNLIFGINKNVNEAFSGKLLLSRCLLGTALIWFAGLNNFASLASIIALVVAVTLIIGLQTRIISSMTAIIMIIASFAKFYPELSIINASQIDLIFGRIAAGIPMSGIECILTSAFFAAIAFFGPGRYSIDQIIRRKAFRAIKRNTISRRYRRLNQAASQRLSYRAFAAE